MQANDTSPPASAASGQNQAPAASAQTPAFAAHGLSEGYRLALMLHCLYHKAMAGGPLEVVLDSVEVARQCLGWSREQLLAAASMAPAVPKTVPTYKQFEAMGQALGFSAAETAVHSIVQVMRSMVSLANRNSPGPRVAALPHQPSTSA